MFSSVGRATSYFSYASRVIAHFVPDFVAVATEVGRGKMRLAAFDGPSPKTPLQAQNSHKNLLRKPSYGPFCPKFRCHGNQGKGKGNGKGKEKGKEKGKGKEKWGSGKGKENGEGEREVEGEGKEGGEGEREREGGRKIA